MLINTLFLILYFLVGFFGTGALWRITYGKYEGPLEGFLLAFMTPVWPVAWLGGLCFAIGWLFWKKTAPAFKAFVKWTDGRSIGSPKQKDMSAW